VYLHPLEGLSWVLGKQCCIGLEGGRLHTPSNFLSAFENAIGDLHVAIPLLAAFDMADYFHVL
jgi:hypothetical protein